MLLSDAIWNSFHWNIGQFDRCQMQTISVTDFTASTHINIHCFLYMSQHCQTAHSNMQSSEVRRITWRRPTFLILLMIDIADLRRSVYFLNNSIGFLIGCYICFYNEFWIQTEIYSSQLSKKKAKTLRILLFVCNTPILLGIE